MITVTDYLPPQASHRRIHHDTLPGTSGCLGPGALVVAVDST